MCGRYSLFAPASTIAEVFSVDVLPDLLPRFNVAPTDPVPAIVLRDGKRAIERFKWGLIPFYAKEAKVAAQHINARAETVSTKPAFRYAYQRHRALVPMDGFFEWLKEGKTKRPHRICRQDGGLFAAAGLWDRWTDPAGTEWRTLTILTTTPNALLAPIHDRMPVLLAPASWDRWLDPTEDPEKLRELLVPAPVDGFHAVEVSSRVGNVKNDDRACVEPLSAAPSLFTPDR